MRPEERPAQPDLCCHKYEAPDIRLYARHHLFVPPAFYPPRRYDDSTIMLQYQIDIRNENIHFAFLKRFFSDTVGIGLPQIIK